MRYSANLNIIIKALEKASKHISRDFVEIENLQSNPATANKFTISCFNRVKDILISDFAKFRPDFTINFADGQIIGDPKNSEYHLTIHAIDGIENLCRASADFTVAIALSHRNNQKLEAISLAISKVIGGELFYSEKGFGAYLNNRRIRISKRSKALKNDYIIACDDLQYAKNLNFVPRNLGCKTLEISYFSCARIEQLIHVKSELYEPFLLLTKEAGGIVVDEGQRFIISNN